MTATIADLEYNTTYCYRAFVTTATVDNGNILADGNWQPIELNCPSGVYILMVTDGNARCTLRLIVR